jgi:hypothetical protein
VRKVAVTGVALLGAVALLVAFVVVVVRPAGFGSLREGAIPARFQRIVEVAADACDGVGAPVLAAQIKAESGWDPQAVSPVGARGIAQFMPGTWDSHGVDAPRPFSGDGRADVWNPYDAIYSAAKYNCELMRTVSNVPGDPIRNVLAAYNAGPYAVLDHGGVPPYAETQAYVSRILQSAEDLSDSGVAGVGGGPAQERPDGDRLTDRAWAVKVALWQQYGRDLEIWGYSTGGHVEGSDHYSGKAVDVSVPNWQTQSGNALGWRMASWLQLRADQLGIKYLIWDGRIWSQARADEGWRPYTHPGGLVSDTASHRDHVHVSTW